MKGKLTTEEVKLWIKDNRASKISVDLMDRYDMIKQLSKPDLLKLIQFYKEKVLAADPKADWHEMCYTGSLCGIDANDNPTGRVAIMCADECPLVPRKE